MSYLIINYEIINGSKLESRPKAIPKDSIEEIDALQKRAEKLWNNGKQDEHKATVLINYIDYNRHNRRSENIGKHDFKLNKWI